MKAKNLYSFLEEIKTHTHLYIGDRKLTTLYNNIIGYRLTCFVHENETELNPDFDGFHDFIAQQLNF